MVSKNLKLLAVTVTLVTGGCDSGSPVADPTPPAKAGPPAAPLPSSLPPAAPSPAVTITKVKKTDETARHRAFVAKYQGNVKAMAQALREMEPTEENALLIADIVFVFTENPLPALENYALIAEAIPASVRSVFASALGRHAAQDAAPDIWIKRIGNSAAPDYYQAIMVAEMFNRLPPSFDTCAWLSRTTASPEMKFAAAATDRSFKEAAANPASLDIIFENVPAQHRRAAAEMLTGSAVEKVDGKLMENLLAMQNPARGDCLEAAALHWGDRSLNEALQWIDTSAAPVPLKARMVEALLPVIENWDKSAAKDWRNKYSP